MASEVERYIQRQREEERKAMTDPRSDAYQQGMELMRQFQQGAEMAMPDMGSAFNHPFFAQNLQQGQVNRETKHKRSVHHINDTEYILTEETTTTETFSFGNNIFRRRRGNDGQGK
jgi:carbohydrate-binding DOMON domain-containing protein